MSLRQSIKQLAADAHSHSEISVGYGVNVFSAVLSILEKLVFN